MYIRMNEFMRVINGGCAAAGSFSRSFRLYVYIVVAGIWMDEKMSKDEGERQAAPKQENVTCGNILQVFCTMRVTCES